MSNEDADDPDFLSIHNIPAGVIFVPEAMPLNGKSLSKRTPPADRIGLISFGGTGKTVDYRNILSDAVSKIRADYGFTENKKRTEIPHER